MRMLSFLPELSGYQPESSSSQETVLSLNICEPLIIHAAFLMHLPDAHLQSQPRRKWHQLSAAARDGVSFRRVTHLLW